MRLAAAATARKAGLCSSLRSRTSSCARGAGSAAAARESAPATPAQAAAVRAMAATTSQIRSRGGDDVEQEAGAEAAGNEGDRAPQAHRSIGAAEVAEPAQRIGIGERHDGRVEGGGERERSHDGGGTLPPGRPRHSPATAAAAAIMIAVRNASCRSAWRVASGMAKTRTIMGIASTMPIAPASSPLAASQTGRNGNCTPSTTKRAA